MQGELVDVTGSIPDASRTGLEFAHRLAAVSTPPAVTELLANLAAAFAADGAGAGVLAGGPPLACRSSQPPPPGWPWDSDPDLRSRLRVSRTALSVVHPDDGCFLVFAAPGLANMGWLIWLECRSRTTWSSAESAAFALAASAVARVLDTITHSSDVLDRLTRQLRLEHAADAIRRIAHDYGNVLTTILGFSELALTQPIPPESAVHRYLKEVEDGAVNGAALTQQIRLFARRQATVSCRCPLAPVVAEEQARLQGAQCPQTKIDVALPDDLPPVAIDGEHLRSAIRALLDNAVEAARKPGTVTVKARMVNIAAEECLDYYGDVRPGPYVELRITDAGDGLTPDVQRRLFMEPFFSTKSCRRGYGLFAVYGVLHAYHGGLRLSNGPERGAVAHVVLPVAVVPAPAIAPSANIEPQTGDKVLVVDDDPLILRFVAGALERAGYRVHSAAGAEEAVAVHGASGGEPFHLLLSDVAMPVISGIELARRLLSNDANVRVLFMTGQAANVDVPKEIAARVCGLIQKPFRSDGLLRAVRTALERGPVRRPAGRAAAPAG
jgi:signal transduction histidine kinase/CheY-like chemotaxis protein